MATVSELQAVHTTRHVDRVLAAAGQSVQLDPDTRTSPGSVDAARLAAGAALQAAERLLEGIPSFVMCRPPGHHATPDQVMGFCLFNNAALAADALARAGKRVLVFDPDVHHGNGTQDIFWSRSAVLFVSMHRFPFYPGTGAADEIGDGTTLNAPMPAGAGDAIYAETLRRRVLPAVRRFRPDVCVISAGYDALRGDPLGGMLLTVEGMAAMWGAILEGIPAMAVLEGGYDLNNLQQGVAATVPILANEAAPPLSTEPVPERWIEILDALPHPLLSV
ncbi:MAG: histone deacetylase, partial [Myxococcota bacterium]